MISPRSHRRKRHVRASQWQPFLGLRHAPWATDDGRRRDEGVGTGQRRIRHAWSAGQLSERSVIFFCCAYDQFSKRSVYPFVTSRSASALRPLLARATSVWSNAVTSCSARQRCRRVQSDVTTSVTQDTFYARERFVGTLCCWFSIGHLSHLAAFVPKYSVTTLKSGSSMEDDISLQLGDEPRPGAVSRGLVFLSVFERRSAPADQLRVAASVVPFIDAGDFFVVERDQQKF